MWRIILIACIITESYCSKYRLVSNSRYVTDHKALITITEKITGFSATFEEYFSRKDRDWDTAAHGAIVIKSKLGHFHYVYRSKAKLAAYVSMDNYTTMCTTIPIQNGVPGFPTTFQWLWGSNEGHQHDYGHRYDYYLHGPTAMITYMLGLKNTWKEAGAATVRGIVARKYTCKVGNLELSAYQQRDGWTGVQGEVNKPFIQFEINGTLPADGVRVKQQTLVDMVVNIINISPGLSLTDRKFLVIPIGRGCNGTDEHKPMAYKRNGFSVNGEISITNDKPGDIGDENPSPIAEFRLISSYEYSTFQISQHSYTKSKNGLVAKGSNVTIVLGNSEYKFEINDGLCQISSDGSYGLTINLPNGNFLNFADPSFLFDFRSYKYLGLTKTRGMLTKVFERTLKELDGNITINNDLIAPGAILTYYELDTRYGSQGDLSSQTPQLWELRILNGPFRKSDKVTTLISITFNQFYKFGLIYEPTKEIQLDVCLSDYSTNLRFQVTYDYDKSSQGFRHHRRRPQINSQSAIKKFLKQLIDVAGINPLRVVNLETTYQNGTGMKITADLLERPPASFDFITKAHGMVFKNAGTSIKDYATYQFVFSNNDCALKCESYQTDDKYCLSYVWCNFNCTVFIVDNKADVKKVTSPLVKANVTEGTNNCIYAEAVDMSDEGLVHRMVYNKDVIRSIEGVIAPFSSGSTADNLNLTTYCYPVSVTTDFAVNNRHGHDEYWQSKFRKVTNGNTIDEKYVKVDLTSNVLQKLTPRYCASQCLEENDFYCSAFSFCEHYRSCYLTDFNPLFGGQEEKMVKRSGCSIFTRNFLEHFKQYPGMLMRTTGTNTVVADENECAKQCVTSKSLGDGNECQSFDYCRVEDDKSNCILHSMHLLDLTSTTQLKSNMSCTHYSRQYIDDYVPKKHLQLKSAYIVEKHTSVSDSVGINDCAKICSTMKGCSAFDMCQNGATKTCSFTKAAYNNAAILISSDFCDFYQGEHNGHQPVYIKSAKDTSSTVKSNGAIIGIAVTLFVVGAAATFGALYFFKRRRQTF